MLAFFSKIFGPKSYAAQKQIADNGQINERLKLAKSKKTHPEILYYLAEHDDDPAVRRTIVENMATPIQTSSILLRDPDTDIRLALADRLVHLWPDIGDQAQSQVYAFAVQSLGVLALDEVLKIRVALSSTLKDFANAPPKIVATLARDVERQVSEPVLRYCIALPDDDLMDILKQHPESWVAEAVAGRPIISIPVSEAIIESENVEAGKTLLRNESIDLSEHVLQHIVEKAKSIPEWQKAVALRKELPTNLAKDLATFVSHSIREVLINRSDFDRTTIEDISEAFQRRMDMMGSTEKDEESYDNKDEAICDAIAVRDKVAIIEVLSETTGMSFEDVDRILGLQSAKSVVAMCWKGKLSMRTAFSLQKDFVKIPPKELLYPRGGSEYPMTEGEIQWQLDFLGV